MQVIYRVFFAAALLAALSSFARADITFGQVDTFQTGDPMGWSQGGPSPNQPTVIPTGGPAGTGDEYLQNVSSGGAGPGSKQIMLNSAQWTGSYVAAGVTRIDLEMADFSAKPLSMRVLIEGGPGGSDFVSSAAFPLPADKAWHQATFDLTSAALQEVEGSDTLAAVLGSVTQIRLLSATSPSSHGDAVAATVGFDDIRALTLPGDANHDGAVNFNDLLVLAQHYNSNVPSWDQGDFNFDGHVGFDDLLLLAQDYGQSVPTPGAAATAQVPEPAAWLIPALAAASVRRSRR